MKNKSVFVFFLSENVQFLVVKFSIYLNKRVFVMQNLFSGKIRKLLTRVLSVKQFRVPALV